ncbi:AAA family ATPase [Nodularia harveyana UHCC-0300]|uniref:histidine kinase n=1 Tax=Nodularia harveyana UHCC-0300 TaxID=2974287 RepID=A0ABU5UBG2_9CYAN|nr:AAA family ATPase [Nodularia harveyana]MEA5580494.1 AAA family ATPase [Nodularia harveyana UHCC-0300]
MRIYLEIPGYWIGETIYESSSTIVYRGKIEADSTPVVIKIMRNQYPQFHQLVQFCNQYTITKNLDIPGIVQPYSLEPYGNRYALIMEDFGGISLKEEISKWQNLDLKTQGNHNTDILREFFPIALQLVTTLDQVHKCRVIHKDIKPANILINPHSREVKLVDFSIASLLPRETQELYNPHILEGTLAYLSPEQTGRMNRGIDYRSDFYSLGITFYEILTGHLPFESDDPMELVHCHIAKQPPAIHELNSDIPQVVSDIVSKLMAKNSEERYQSALGLKYDLERCLHLWEETHQIPHFDLGEQDISERFMISEKLYGREIEVNKLLAAFERISLGSSELIMVVGFSGIGKTVVVNEIHKPIARQRGYFIKGKFEQFQRNIPFLGFVQAFKDLMAQLLSETDTQLQQWKSLIMAALGEQGQVIIEVIPELEQIIGKQPSIPKLSGNLAQNRFNLLFQKFIRVFTNPDHPLIIFLDDLQWADSASLKLMQLLMAETNNGYLLLIGAYRDNEVNSIHPLVLTLDEIYKSGTVVNIISLPPLSKSHLSHLVADTFSCSLDLAAPLTELVYQKTQGNPFFTNQFIKSLYEDGWINFNRENACWQCDISEIKALSLTDDILDFMAAKLQKLPTESQKILQLAACIGNSFDLATLAVVYEKSQTETAINLWKALQESLILPLTDVYKFFQGDEYIQLPTAPKSIGYRFLHDRVQQAAYALIPDDQKQKTHLKIGKLLLNNLSELAGDDQIFEIVNQLNIGANLITEVVDKNKLIQLNIMAGSKAKISTAYASAVEYFTHGINLLGEDGWNNDYNSTFALYKELAESEFLNGDFEKSLVLIDKILLKAKSPCDQGEIYELLIVEYIVKAQLLEAIETGIKALRLLDVEIDLPDLDAAVQKELAAAKENIGDRQISTLIDLPEMVDMKQRLVVRLLVALVPPSYISSNFNLYMLVSLKAMNLSIQYGNLAESAMGYSGYGLILGTFMGDYQSGYEFGLLGVKLSQKFNYLAQVSQTSFVLASFIQFWAKPIKGITLLHDQGYEAGLNSGELQYAGYHISGKTCNQLFQGTQLDIILEYILQYLPFIINTKNQSADYNLKGVRFFILELLSTTAEMEEVSIYDLPKNQFIEECIASKSFFGLGIYYVLQMQLSCINGNFQQGLKDALAASEIINSIAGHTTYSEYNFYYSLILLNLYDEANQDEKNEYEKQVITNQKQLKIWADNCPENFLNKYCLVEAELSRVNRKTLAAVDLYDHAIELSATNGFIHNQALANELTARFYLDWGKNRIAEEYMLQAYYGYIRWGAKAKVEDLKRQYRQLLEPIFSQNPKLLAKDETIVALSQSSNSESSSVNASFTLDLETVLKVSQTLSNEIQLQNLLATLMQVMIANAGAEKCVLMLLDQQELMIEAIANSTQTPIVLQSIPVEDSLELPLSLINMVKRRQESAIITNASVHPSLLADPYIVEQQPKSLLCTPILHQGKLLGILYLENNLTTGAFTSDRVEILNLICSQAAISLKNARLYQQSQNYAQQIEKSLQDLQQIQLQLVQSEKMSALGNLVSGIAHEINNPIGFIAGNLEPAVQYVQDLFSLIDLYKQHYPQPVAEITQQIVKIDLEYIRSDLPNLISTMEESVKRMRGISNSLRVFSRSDRDIPVIYNIHDSIDSTLVILKHRLKANDQHPDIQVVKDYDHLPQIRCFAGQINQVFMNLLSNAIDALEEANAGYTFFEIAENPNIITIKTRLSQDKNRVFVRIRDNGVGISAEVREKIFDHLFTTKPVGQGTGLGLAIAWQIVVDKHRGNLEVESTPGEGTEFIITLPINVQEKN